MQGQGVLGRLVIRQFGKRHASHKTPIQSTYNDLPQPQGSWKTHYDSAQRKNNAQLVLGIGVLGGTILFGKVAGLWDFHNDIPEHPAVIASYK